MKMSRRLIAAFILTSVFCPLTPVFSQGALTPPGAPAATFKTLQQIEPRTPISSLPFTINTSGAYYLTSSLTGIAGQAGITVGSDHVAIDLNGFELIGIPGTSSGIVLSNRSNVTIRHGTIRNWQGAGTSASNASEIRVEDVRALNNGTNGISLGINSEAERCEARANNGRGIIGGDSCKIIACSALAQTSASGAGISVGTNSVVTGCTAVNNGDDGFDTGESSAITECAASGNAGDGFAVGPGCAFSNCTASHNNGNGFGGISTTNVSMHNCTAYQNTGNGISASANATLMNCLAQENQGAFGINAGLVSTIIGCVARDNTSSAATSAGINVSGGSFVSQCEVSGSNSTLTLNTGTGMGINVASHSVVERCLVRNCTGDGIRAPASCTIIGNQSNVNGTGATANAAGIHITSSGNRIEANTVISNDRGIDVDGAQNVVIKNMAHLNSVAYQIAADNRFGPILNITGAGVAAQNISDASASVSSVMASDDPWANFLY